LFAAFAPDGKTKSERLTVCPSPRETLVGHLSPER